VRLILEEEYMKLELINCAQDTIEHQALVGIDVNLGLQARNILTIFPCTLQG
jgi:hypothetical protein